MGLDMYLERMPRYKDTTPKQVHAIENYFIWQAKKKDSDSSANKYTMKEWCGIHYGDVPKGDALKFYKSFFTERYSEWDKEHKYPLSRIIEEVGYWRKANQIHRWFVNNIQDGIDDCEYHREITRDDLENLLSICNKVLSNCKMVYGQVVNGYEFKDNGMQPILEAGKIVLDSSVAEELLPRERGFFFGGYDYDEYYVGQIQETIEIINNVLNTTDFETQMIAYVSSW